MQRAKRLIRIDPGAKIITDADELRVIGRRGVFLIRGQGIQKLHGRIGPLLDGRFTGEHLMRAAGEKGDVVSRYLDGLKQAGAISDGPELGSLPEEFPSAIAGVQAMRLGRLRIVVCLDRLLEPPRRTLLVHFGSAAQVERLLLSRQRITVGTTEIVVEISAGDETDLLASRVKVARHLLAVELSRGTLEGGVSLYKAGPGVTLRRCAVVRPGESSQLGVWSQMNIVHLADLPQVPLAVFAGELPGHRRRCLGVGLSAHEVEPRVLLHMVAKTYLSIAASSNEYIAGSLISTTALRARGRVNIALTSATSERATIGLTRSDCIEALLCSHVLQHSEGRSGRRCDLLREVSTSPRVSMLQRLLRLRRDACEGHLHDQCHPIVVFRGCGMVVARLGYEATIAEALVRAIAAEYYRSVNVDVVAVPGSQTTSTERRRLRRALQRFPTAASFAISRFRRLGLTFYAGFRLEAPSIRT